MAASFWAVIPQKSFTALHLLTLNFLHKHGWFSTLYVPMTCKSPSSPLWHTGSPAQLPHSPRWSETTLCNGDCTYLVWWRGHTQSHWCSPHDPGYLCTRAGMMLFRNFIVYTTHLHVSWSRCNSTIWLARRKTCSKYRVRSELRRCTCD